MNQNKAKGIVDEAAGRTKRQVGEWTGNTSSQVKGAAQEVKGKVEKTIGQMQDAVHKSPRSAAKGSDR